MLLVCLLTYLLITNVSRFTFINVTLLLIIAAVVLSSLLKPYELH